MYNPEVILADVSHRAGLIVALGAVALLCNWYYFFECARLAQRDRCAPMALWATTVFIGHDGSYLLKYNDWFHHYDHWFPKLFWVGLIVTFSFEVIFFVQTVRFGRKEIAPRLSQAQWTAYCLGALVTGIVFWAVTKHYLDDPLYLMTFLVTFGMCAPATIPFMIRRGARIGVGARQMWAYLGIGVGYVLLTTGILRNPFTDYLWILGSLVCAGLAAALLVLVYRLPERADVPAPASRPDPALRSA
ncbi:hypothetical protein ACFXG4_36895 [Nocardia sp. NPDC059246]|uniref:hypothetical protein n=1 Tax=unclassified Nocardia TaxID=2637762 RepID=UPI0036736FC6